jgi:hypothetical protein
MLSEITGGILYFVYELCILFASIRVVYKIANATHNDDSLAEQTLLWVSVSIILSISIATFLSFIAANGVIQYLMVVVLLLGLTHIGTRCDLMTYRSYLMTTLQNIVKVYNWKLVVTFALLVPALLIAMKPIDEIDSLWNLNYILDWGMNLATPYVMAYNYNPNWELNYLASLIITK